MIKYVFLALLVMSASAYAKDCTKEIAPFFKGNEGCFLLYNLTKERYDIRFGGAACERRFSPASSFKIPNSLIGLDLGILKDENSSYKWDGTKQMFPIWEQDHTLASAIKNSVVWYYQRLASEVGEAHYQGYLKRFSYGNQDISSGLTEFWLGKSLKITPEEQLTFLQKLYRNQLPVSHHASEVVKKILVLEATPTGILSGKTGTASVDSLNIGWFIGHLSTANTEYVVVTNITKPGNDYKIGKEYAGAAAKAVAKEILSCKQLLD